MGDSVSNLRAYGVGYKKNLDLTASAVPNLSSKRAG